MRIGTAEPTCPVGRVTLEPGQNRRTHSQRATLVLVESTEVGQSVVSRIRDDPSNSHPKRVIFAMEHGDMGHGVHRPRDGS